MIYKDYTNLKVGHLTLISFSHRVKGAGRGTFWNCACDCGGSCCIRVDSIARAHVCGRSCPFHGTTATHGMTRTPIYRVWRAMLDRCYLVSSENYPNYGGRGIKVCKRWHEFQNFWDDFGNGWAQGLEMDRINNDGNYEKKNCRWTTRKVQTRNARYNINIITPYGKMCVADAAQKMGLSASMIYSRIRKGETGAHLLRPSRRAK